MLPSRFIRVTAMVLALLFAAAVALGYDFHLETNIIDTFVDRTDLCF
jgi:hypothetical protein